MFLNAALYHFCVRILCYILIQLQTTIFLFFAFHYKIVENIIPHSMFFLSSKYSFLNTWQADSSFPFWRVVTPNSVSLSPPHSVIFSNSTWFLLLLCLSNAFLSSLLQIHAGIFGTLSSFLFATKMWSALSGLDISVGLVLSAWNSKLYLFSKTLKTAIFSMKPLWSMQQVVLSSKII